MYDRRLGQTESTLKDLALEATAILSGAAAVRKVGLYALMGVTVGEAMLPAANSPEKQQKLQRRFEKLAVKNAIEFGTNSYVKRQWAYAEVARAAKPSHQYRDPFEAFK